MSIRQRSKPVVTQAIDYAQEFDAFGKLQEDYQETSPTRGTFSILVYVIISVLVFVEVRNYFDKQLTYSYQVNYDHESKLKMNVDITVAMPCGLIGADVMDSTSRDMLTDQTLTMEDTWFELSPQQSAQFEHMTRLNAVIRSHYHAVHSTLWDNYKNAKLRDREVFPTKGKDACRIFGTFDLNKVAGNFHIIKGKSVSFMGNHAHMTNLFDTGENNNFSHRIDNLSFGEPNDIIHNALDFELKVTEKKSENYQYFVSIVSTDLGSGSSKIVAYQYAASEKIRHIDHDTGSHGMPGIFFKYDISPIKVQVVSGHKSLLELIVPLIGIIGGIFATSIMLNSLVQNFQDFFSCFK